VVGKDSATSAGEASLSPLSYRLERREVMSVVI